MQRCSTFVSIDALPYEKSLRRSAAYVMWCACGAVALTGCFRLQSPKDGGEATKPRKFDARDVLLPEHYRVELVASGFTLPTAVTFDERGRTYVLEAGYANGEAFDWPRLLELGPAGRRTVVAAGHNGPWTGIVYHQGAFYVAEGGELEGGRILRIEGGRTTPIVEGLPSQRDPRTNGPAIGPDGWLYFSVGTSTNAAIADSDNALGSPGAVLRVRMNGGEPELVAWGFRNPFGLAFAPDGNLYVSDNAYDSRGSRPAVGAADPFWRVDYQPPDGPISSRLLGHHE